MRQKELKKQLVLQKETVTQLDNKLPKNFNVLPSGHFSFCCPAPNRMDELVLR